MSTYSQQYYSYPTHTLDIASHTFTFDQYGARRSKTPTDSLLNHTGHSPGPLTTTPPISRNPSQPPEPFHDQQFEQILCDNGSLSDSPTSVRTPDHDSFEVEMLDADMRHFYHQSIPIMSTQAPNSALPATDNGVFFSEQALQDAYNAALAAAQHPYHQQYNASAQQNFHMSAVSTYDPAYNQNYTTQSPQQDLWNGQAPSRSSMVPRSGLVGFDPESDHLDYADYLHDVDNWATNYDPSNLVSPSEPTLPPQDIFATSNQYLPRRTLPQQDHQIIGQSHSPVEMQITRASPPPDQQNFVNYDARSRLFTESYITGNQVSASISVASSNRQFPHSPYQPAISPSAASPISSDDVFSSYEHSDHGMMLEAFSAQHFNQAIATSSSPLEADIQAAKSLPELTFDNSPEPESSRTAAARALAKSGGRALGTHLEPTVAKAAHDMRKIVACWHCVLQRDKCGPGDVCERCLKRAQRPNADCGLGCSRIKLVDLSTYFLPALITQMHEDSHLTHFVTQYIHQWGNVEITVYMTCGQHTMPRVPVKVYEFWPNGRALLEQLQYRTDPKTKQTVVLKKESPALGMLHINPGEEKKYDKYIMDIVDHHIDAFGDLCWADADNDFQQKLFRLMTRVKPKSEDEAKLLREVFRLIVVTFIMSHTLTIAEETKAVTLSKMQSYRPDVYVDNFTSPRMTNRQLKYFFSRLQRSIQTNVLNKLQQIFKSSKGCDKWLAAFVAVLGMNMALEDQQRTIHLVMSTRSRTEGLDARDAQGQADIACREIDSRMHFIQQIFRWKYNRKCNPMRDTEHAWDKEVGFGDASSVNFVRQVAQLVKENIDFLQQRQQVSISADNQNQYTSRLVGQFLLSFWLPNA
ncbi:hypothetical protein ACN47E_001136 [Coniothyrium glycines]